MLHQLLLRYVTRTYIQRNKKAHQGGQERTSRHASAKAFGMVGNPLPTSLRSGGSEGDLMRLNGWKSRAMVDRYADDVANQRALEAKRRRGDMF